MRRRREGKNSVAVLFTPIVYTIIARNDKRSRQIMMTTTIIRNTHYWRQRTPIPRQRHGRPPPPALRRTPCALARAYRMSTGGVCLHLARTSRDAYQLSLYYHAADSACRRSGALGPQPWRARRTGRRSVRPTSTTRTRGRSSTVGARFFTSPPRAPPLWVDIEKATTAASLVIVNIARRGAVLKRIITCDSVVTGHRSRRTAAIPTRDNNIILWTSLLLLYTQPCLLGRRVRTTDKLLNGLDNISHRSRRDKKNHVNGGDSKLETRTRWYVCTVPTARVHI